MEKRQVNFRDKSASAERETISAPRTLLQGNLHCPYQGSHVFLWVLYSAKCGISFNLLILRAFVGFEEAVVGRNQSIALTQNMRYWLLSRVRG